MTRRNLVEIINSLGGGMVSYEPSSIRPANEIHIDRISIDSREVGPTTLFVCLRGENFDGHSFANEVASQGAAGLVVDHVLEDLRHIYPECPQVVVRNTRAQLGPIAVTLNGNPSATVNVIGVTGTNGKTTTCSMVQFIFEVAGIGCGMIGTLSSGHSTRTTPEAHEIQRRLAEMRDEGLQACAMEVSSHGLGRNRVDGVQFLVGCFLNLTLEHSDEHPTMEQYFATKARLFTEHRVDHAVIWTDDSYGERLAKQLMGKMPVTEVSIDQAQQLAVERDGSRFIWQGEEIALPMLGRHNVANALMAATASSVAGIATNHIVAGLAGFHGINGRFELVHAGQPFVVAVDYAHTPDGVAALVRAGRELASEGRLLVVMGAGGDRDRSKRQPMGKIAAKLADSVWLTSDNPRSEDPESIINELWIGATAAISEIRQTEIRQIETRQTDLHRVTDRAQAIYEAIGAAGPKDVVLIAGKGHETYQEVAGVRLPFDDRQVAKDCLRSLGFRREWSKNSSMERENRRQ